jgi:hypothetical protein
MHIRSVDQAAAEIAQAAFEIEFQAIQDPDPQRMFGIRVFHHDVAKTLLHQLSDFQIDCIDFQLLGVKFGAFVEVNLVGAGI